MSRLVAKIMLALLMLPLAGVLYIVSIVSIAYFAFGFGPPDEIPFLITTVIVWVFVASYWTLLWRGTVIWTRRRRGLTLAAAALSLVPAALGGFAVTVVDTSFAAFLGGIIAIVCWLAATVFIWQETRNERIARVKMRRADVMVCPGCGYNLTGLRQTACPECGASYTIDELVPLQPGREEEKGLGVGDEG